MEPLVRKLAGSRYFASCPWLYPEKTGDAGTAVGSSAPKWTATFLKENRVVGDSVKEPESGGDYVASRLPSPDGWEGRKRLTMHVGTPSKHDAAGRAVHRSREALCRT
jgi:hypothetical protein